MAAFMEALCFWGLLACVQMSQADQSSHPAVRKDTGSHQAAKNYSPENGRRSPANVHPMTRDRHPVLYLIPDSFLPGVSQNVEITCKPPQIPDVARVLMLQLYRKRTRGNDVIMDPVADFVTSGSPVLEALGVSLGASVSGSYNASHPIFSQLRVDIPHPTDAADGRYMCVIEALDSLGLVHRYDGSAPLTSLAKNASVPQFYHNILQELRRDLDNLNLDLTNVTDVQSALQANDKNEESKLLAITAESNKAQSLLGDVISLTTDVDQQVTSLRSEINRLDDITPDPPVSFYAYLTSSYVTLTDGAVIVFNSSPQQSDNSYSTTKGVFTVPVNGTYRFMAGVTGPTNIRTAASINVNGQEVASLFAFDDYQYSQATAHVVVELAVGDEVKVVKKTGTRIYGSYNVNNVSYFTGMLLW